MKLKICLILIQLIMTLATLSVSAGPGEEKTDVAHLSIVPQKFQYKEKSGEKDELEASVTEECKDCQQYTYDILDETNKDMALEMKKQKEMNPGLALKTVVNGSVQFGANDKTFIKSKASGNRVMLTIGRSLGEGRGQLKKYKPPTEFQRLEERRKDSAISKRDAAR